MQQSPEVHNGLFTLLWTEFDLGANGVQPGTRIDLELRIENEGGCIVAFTRASYIVLA
jgi:hypothetical protein